MAIGGSYGDDGFGDIASTNNGQAAINRANKYWGDGLIDNPANFNNDPVFIYSGGRDVTVPPSFQDN